MSAAEAGRPATLQRSLSPFHVSLLTLSVLSPGVSVLVAGVDVIHRVGTWSALAFLLGGLLTLLFMLSQAELGAAFPLAGGDYATIGHAMGPRAGFVQFALVSFSAPVFLALSAAGTSLYLRVLMPGLPPVGTAVGAMALAAAFALLNIRTGAKLTGTFLAVELGALALVTLLGFAHPVQSLASLLVSPLSPLAGSATALAAPTWGAMIIAVVAASGATAGAGQAIYFSEEMHSPRKIGHVVMLIGMLTVLFEFLPVLGLALGTVNLTAVMGSDSPFTAFIAARGSPLIATLVTLGIIAAMFNALISGLTCYGRFLYSTGRDRIWSETLNGALVRLHARTGCPWVATLAIAAIGAAFCVLPLDALVPLLSFVTLVQWVLLSLACLAGRRRGLTGTDGRFRAPWFPLPQIVTLAAVAALSVLLWQDRVGGRPGEIAVAVVVVVALLYHALVLGRRAGGWVLHSQPTEEYPA